MAATSSPPPAPSTTFRFKSSHRSSVDKPSFRKHDRQSHHHHRRHHPSKHRSHHPYPTPPLSPRPPSPNTAFRESLFDALADDEGAAYWEGVYGQPIHTYARPNVHEPYDNKEEGEGEGKGEDGEKEEGNVHMMDDEEYVSYVRRKMWEKSHGYIFEERARREEGRKRRKEEERRERKKRRREEDEEVFEEIGEEDGENDPRVRLHDPFTRKEVIREEDTKAWARYQSKWEKLLTTTSPSHDANHHQKPKDPNTTSPAQDPNPPRPIRNLIPWPTSSRTYKSLSSSTIETFFRENVPPSTNHQVEIRDGEFLRKVMKLERVRWHPDKMQQRLGQRLRMDEETLRGVTMVFQVVDGLYQRLGD